MQYSGGFQCKGGTTSVRRRVYSVDQSHHQYKGGTSSVLTKVCNTDQLHHLHSPECAVQDYLTGIGGGYKAHAPDCNPAHHP